MPNSCRVLIVDDNQDTAEAFAELIALDGHPTRIALDGRSALEHAREFRPDFAFIDLWLTDMQGCELARLLRALPELAATTLIAMTGDTRESMRLQACEAGFAEVMIKPLQPSRIDELLNSYRARPD